MSQVIQQLTMNNGQAAHITAVVLDQNGQVMAFLNPSIIDTSSARRLPRIPAIRRPVSLLRLPWAATR